MSKKKTIDDNSSDRVLTALDLFSGAGGFSLGLTSVGFKILGAFDNWDTAVNTYSLNFKHHPVVKSDLLKLNGTELLTKVKAAQTKVDLIVGGPPCQGFSIQRIGSDHDSRNHLVLEFARFVSEIQPRLFLMENVPGLLGKRGKELVAEFSAKLNNAGYEISSAVINAADYGVPQLRKRVVFAGWVKGGSHFAFPVPSVIPEDYRNVASALEGLPSPPVDFSPLADDPLHRKTRLSALNQQRMELIPPGGGMQDLPDELKVKCHRVGAEKIGHRYVYGRLAANKPAATITARFDSFTRGKFGHPVEHRNITLREGARLQSFPDSFIITGTQEEIAAQIGNAVPPRVAEALAQAAALYLTGGESKDPARRKTRV